MNEPPHGMPVHDPLEDPGRLRALRTSGLIGVAAVPALDRLTDLAARLVKAPVAAVSLVSDTTHVFRSAHGLPGVRELPLAHSYCRLVVRDGQPVVITDARTDKRVAGNAAIERYAAVAYAGVPVRTPAGWVLGSFCVIDSRPRQWTPDELAVLRDLAVAAESEIAARSAQAELLRSAARMRAVLDGARDAFISVDEQGRVLEWNTAAETMFGCPAADAVGKPVTSLILPARHRDTFLADLAEAARMPLSVARLRQSVVDTAGRSLLAEVTVQATTGEPAEFHLFLRDITVDDAAERDRLHRQDQLADERTFLQTLLDSLDTGVVACDSAGRLSLFNRALRQIHGIDPTKGGGEGWADNYHLYAEDGRTPLGPDQIALRRAFAGETVSGQNLVVQPPGRPPRRFVANAKPIDSPDGRRLGAVATMHEVTEQHHAEQLHRARHAVTRALADATNAEDAAAGAVAAITATLGWACGQYWQVDETHEHIAAAGTYCDPDLREPPDPAAFTDLTEQVWRRGTELWTGSPHPGLGACVGVPIRSDDVVLGVLTFATGGRPLYDEGTSAMLDAACTHVGRFIERRHTEDLTLALAATRRDFDRVIDRVNDYVWTIEITPDGRTRPVYASPDGSGVFGTVLPTDADMAAEMAGRMHPDDMPAFAAFQRKVADGRTAEIECRVHGGDGITRWVWTRATPRREGDRLFADGISTNVTERHRLADQQRAATRTAQEAEQLLAAVGAVSRRIRSGEDARTTIMAAIQQLADADYVGLVEPDSTGPGTGLSVTASIGAPLVGTRISLDESAVAVEVYRGAAAIFVPDIAADPRVSVRLQQLIDARSMLAQPVVAGDEVVAVLIAFWRARAESMSDHRARAMALLADETALAMIHEQLLRRLERMAHTDTLTGLANRRTWQTDLPRLFARARRNRQPLTVAIIDLDHFKRYNDTYGHPAGDDLLRRCAAAFTDVLRDGDLIVRWGGEEFAVALVDCAGDDAVAVLDRVRTASPDAQTCSIGYATWDGTETAERLLSRADEALYAAKSGGRDTIRAAR
ncbi:diguanylate cyclase [Paractinoplanes ferrugineus]|uniref:diguanylate cyclase n=1 Tax=Paractinoplanes ferrugineus TaxID=113564 RepID=UPI00194280EB|nr:diguanylate cyclase [Actinoplanes ferrugineus]